MVLLFLHGGPPHLEFFDPKPHAPQEIRSVTGEIQTNLPGVLFGGTFPRLAAIAESVFGCAVLRFQGVPIIPMVDPSVAEIPTVRP